MFDRVIMNMVKLPLEGLLILQCMFPELRLPDPTSPIATPPRSDHGLGPTRPQPAFRESPFDPGPAL